MAELFDRFEVDRVPRWPLLSRLVALSVVLHGVFFVAVVYVPALRSLLYVAGSVSGIEFVSEDYDRSLVGQRATVIKLEPYEKLYYPSDYFGPPPEAVSPEDPMLMAQVAPPPPPVVIRPPRVRQPRAQVIATPEPEPVPSPVEIAQATPSPSPDEAQQKAREAELDKIAAASGVERPPRINTKPFEDIAQKGKTLFDEGKLKLDGTVGVTATAERNEDGTFKRDTVKLEWEQASDENMALLAQEFITALSESKVLSLLKGVKNVQMKLRLDQEKLSVRIASEVETDARASQMATGYGLLLAGARRTREGTDEGELYKNLNVSADGRHFVMNFEMPREVAGKMLTAMLAKKAAAAQGKG
jgi:outer membrane biosynthesis protein TonB